MGIDFAAGFLVAVETLREPLLPLWAMELLASLFLYAWLFCLGATVGSFLNVVIYRLPRGKNLAYPGSFCPHCGHAIRWADTIPIVSWLALRGRCRDCREPISPRYFLVELAVAAIFLSVALVETKLPGFFPRRNWDMGDWLISPYDTLPFWTTYGLHVVLLTTLLGAALIEYDGFPTPTTLFVPALFAGLAVPVIWPSSAHLPRLVSVGTYPWTALMEVLSTSAVGLLCGVIVDLTGRWANRRRMRWFAPEGLLATVGAVLGWPHILEVSAAGVILWAGAMLAARCLGRISMPPLAGAVFLATIPRLLSLDMRLSHAIAWPQGHFMLLTGCFLGATLLAALAASLLAPEVDFSPPSMEAPPTATQAGLTTAVATTEILTEELPPQP